MPRKRKGRGTYGEGGIVRRGKLWSVRVRAWEDPRLKSGPKRQVWLPTKREDRNDALTEKRRFIERIEHGDYHWDKSEGRWGFRWGPRIVLASDYEVPTSSSAVTFEHMRRWIVADYKAKGRKMLGEIEAKIRNHLVPFFGSMMADEIKAAHVQMYVIRRQEAGASVATVNRELSILRRMYSIGMNELELLERRPRIRALPENNARQGFFEREELQRLLPELPEHLRAPVSFAYETGWRFRSEVLCLRWENVDLEAREVRLWPGTTKTGQGRVLRLSGIEQGILASQAAMREWFPDCAWVFHNAGRPIISPTKAWNRACAAAGLSGKVPHDMRRSAVRNLVRAGVSEKLAMERTGHRTRSVFDRYDISSDRDRRAVAAALDRAHRAEVESNLRALHGEQGDDGIVTH